jgi:hypothetical protein
MPASTSRRSFILYAVAGMNAPSLDGRLSFRLELIEHLANLDWIEPALNDIRKCLMLDEAPAPAADCELCSYVAAVKDAAKGTT